MWEVGVFIINTRPGEAGVSPRAQQLRGWELGVFTQRMDPERYRALLRFA